jgi:hypothetical protein
MESPPLRAVQAAVVMEDLPALQALPTQAAAAAADIILAVGQKQAVLVLLLSVI